MIAGLEQPDSGEIIIDGREVNDVPASERGIDLCSRIMLFSGI